MKTKTISQPGEYLAEHGPVALLTVSLLAASAYLQIYACRSPIGLPAEVWEKNLDLHLSWYPFAIRYFQTYTTLFIHEITNLPLKESFYSIQFTLATILSLVFYRYLRLMDFGQIWSTVGVALLLAAYPMFGAHFAPTHTWDDFWAYLFITTTLLFLLKNRWVTVAIFFTLGCFAREQMLLFYPMLGYYAWQRRHQPGRMRRLICLLAPVVLYGVFRLLVWEELEFDRWQLPFNFGDMKHTTDTVVSVILAFGFMWLTAFIGLVRRHRKEDLKLPALVYIGALTTLPLTVGTALCFSFARETRVFFPAFVVMIPLTLIAFRSTADHIIKNWTAFTWIIASVSLGILVWLGIQFSNIVFANFDYATNSEFRRPLAGIQIGLMAFIIVGYAAAHFGRVWNKIQGVDDTPL